MSNGTEVGNVGASRIGRTSKSSARSSGDAGSAGTFSGSPVAASITTESLLKAEHTPRARVFDQDTVVRPREENAQPPLARLDRPVARLARQ